MNKQLQKNFVTAVKSQVELYKRLKQVLTGQEKILVLKDAKGLDETANKQEIIIAEIKKIEDEKKAVFADMAASVGLKYTPELKLQDVLSKAGDEDAAEIDRETAKLIILIEEIVALNSGNRKLMKNYLDFVKFSEKLRENFGKSAQPLYTPDGIINKETVIQSKFDQKI